MGPYPTSVVYQSLRPTVPRFTLSAGWVATPTGLGLDRRRYSVTAALEQVDLRRAGRLGRVAALLRAARCRRCRWPSRSSCGSHTALL